MHRISKVLAAFALVALTATTAEAQLPFTIGAHGGVAIPTGDGADNVKVGPTVGVEFGFAPVALPVGLRVDLDWARFAGKDLPPGTDASVNIWSGTVNAIIGLPGGGLSPYLIGGVGMFNSRHRETEGGVSMTATESDFGFQGGAGIRFALGGLAAGLEARYVSISTEGSRTNYIPIVLRVAAGGN